jgi:hypothetical protein
MCTWTSRAALRYVAQRLHARRQSRLVVRVGHADLDVDDRLGVEPGHRRGADVLDAHGDPGKLTHEVLA